MSVLTANDPMPPLGTSVQDALGRVWTRDLPPDGVDNRNGYWLLDDGGADSDPESWIKVAGNYGPVTIVDRR